MTRDRPPNLEIHTSVHKDTRKKSHKMDKRLTSSWRMGLLIRKGFFLFHDRRLNQIITAIKRCQMDLWNAIAAVMHEHFFIAVLDSILYL